MEKRIASELMQEVPKLAAQVTVITHKIHEVSLEADRVSCQSCQKPCLANILG